MPLESGSSKETISDNIATLVKEGKPAAQAAAIAYSTAQDTAPGAAGVLFTSQGEVLLVKRADSGAWGIPGGGIEAGETPLQAAMRECMEELGYKADATDAPPAIIATVNNPDGVQFTCYSIEAPEPFTVVLNDEHTAYAWCDPQALPQPLFMCTADLVAAVGREAPVMDKMDQSMSARRMDYNGWYEIPRQPISKVGVFQYLGKNIPGAVPDRVYNVLRPAEELSAPDTIESIKLLPWIDNHTMLGNKEGTTPAEKKGIQGVMGQDVVFDGGTLYANLKLFSAEHGATIDSGKTPLSLGYRCKYFYEPGVYADGTPYDYVQRQIRGNHIASVNDGRMGPEVAVLDHFSFTFDSKDLQIMADPENKTPEGGGEPTIADAVNLLKSLAPLIQQLAATGSAAPATPAVVEDKAPATGSAAPATPATAAGGTPAAAPAVAEDNKQVAAMDAAISAMPATIMRALAQRDRLAAALVPHVGAFDHSEMTPGQVEKYGLEKLGIKAPAGQEGAYLAGYLQAKPNPGTARVASAMDSTDAPTSKPAFLAAYNEE